jgi:hypothetical protein
MKLDPLLHFRLLVMPSTHSPAEHIPSTFILSQASGSKLNNEFFINLSFHCLRVESWFIRHSRTLRLSLESRSAQKASIHFATPESVGPAHVHQALPSQGSGARTFMCHGPQPQPAISREIPLT